MNYKAIVKVINEHFDNGKIDIIDKNNLLKIEFEIKKFVKKLLNVLYNIDEEIIIFIFGFKIEIYYKHIHLLDKFDFKYEIVNIVMNNISFINYAFEESIKNYFKYYNNKYYNNIFINDKIKKPNIANYDYIFECDEHIVEYKHCDRKRLFIYNNHLLYDKLEDKYNDIIFNYDIGLMIYKNKDNNLIKSILDNIDNNLIKYQSNIKNKLK